MTEVLLLGTFHFRGSSIDCSSEIQDKLDLLTQKLSEFNSDTIAVELAVHQQDAVSNA